MEVVKSGVYPAFPVLLFRNMMQDYKKNWRFICVCKKIGVFLQLISIYANDEKKRSDEDIHSDSLL